MTTNVNPTKPPVRSTLHGQVGELRQTANFNDQGILTGVPMKNAMPANSIVTNTIIIVKTPMSGGTLVVGSTPGGSDLVAAADSAATVAGVKRPETATAIGKLPADTVPYVTMTGAPTAGQVEVILFFVSPRP